MTLLHDSLDIDAPSIAREVLARMEERDPELFARYPPAGRIRCLDDTLFHLQFLSAAVALDEPALFEDYRGWLTDLLGERGIPETDVAANFATLAEVIDDLYGADAAPATRLLRGR